MKRVIVKGGLGLAAGFVALFGLRLGYGYLSTPEPDEGAVVQGFSEPSGFEFSRNNYASSSLKRAGKAATTQAAASTTIDQKYEKVAEIKAGSRAFEDDEALIRKTITTHGGLIQFERRAGLEDRRVLDLAIGVDPARFDAFIADVKGVGRLGTLRIHKVDKTNDYKELQASRAALENTRASLTSLKGRSGSLDEAIRLEERILEIDERIQRLGISLGEFDAENEFCTVKMTLAETSERPAVGIPFWQRAKVSFEWTVPMYLALVMTTFFGLLALVLLMVALQKWRALREALAALVRPATGITG